MKYIAGSVVLAAIASSSAVAGDEVLYGDPPEWVIEAPLDDALEANKGDVALYDRQIRLEDGVVTRFTDLAYDIRNTENLESFGTLQFTWLPDKGDLTIHRLDIIRGDEVIDLLEQGVEPSVIRRERRLESRAVDGQLTAAINVPGLRIGDILRLTSSTTVRDQALEGEMQSTEGVTTRPTRLGFGRLRYSWPSSEEVNWGTIGQVDNPEVTIDGDDSVLEMALPIARPRKMPEDAPDRFTVSPLIQVGSFADWQEVSSVMARHFTTAGTIEADGPIADEIAKIRAATDDPLERAALALQLVQDEVTYLLNGLNGGNYIPQAPEETWELRYGDCKAKSLLLLAMLRELGIESEAVLVDIDAGDVVSVSQPVPGAFDHMIVHAMIDGKDYWLDGTGSGVRLDTIDEVPGFDWALPLRSDGAELVSMEQRWPQTPDRIVRVTYDMSRGVDFPATYEAVVELRGSMGASMRPMATENDEMQILAKGIEYFSDLIGGMATDAEYSYDDETGVAVIKGRGMLWDVFSFENGNVAYAINGPSVGWGFDPDRARRAWKDIPFQVAGPYTVRREAEYLLPNSNGSVEFEGHEQLDELASGVRFTRDVTLSDGVLRMVDGTSQVPIEIAAEDIQGEKLAMSRIASGDPILRIDAPERSWDLSDAELQARLLPIATSLDEMTELPEASAAVHFLRGIILVLARQYDEALADIDLAIEEGAEADHYSARAAIYDAMGDLQQALVNAQEAYDLEPNLETASSLAQYLAKNGDADYGLDLLDELGLVGDEAIDMQMAWSELSGAAQREDEAWERTMALLETRPEESALHNAQCWLAGIWSFRVAEAEEFCENAVQLSDSSAGTLDSRALVRYRLGQTDQALDDLNEALRKQPGQAASRLLRGIIRLEQGDETGGAGDVLAASRIDPSIIDLYRTYGFDISDPE